LNLALALAERGVAVGILDADVYGPNIPLMVGLTRKAWTGDWTLARSRQSGRQPLLPAIERYGLKIMSAGFILGEDQPMILQAMTIRLLAAQLVRQVDWGDLDYLVVDLPPGTADIQQFLVREIAFTGAIIVVTPQDVAHLDARKAVQMYRRAGIPVLGAIKNMTGLACPHCGGRVDVFPRVPEGRAIWAMGVDAIEAIPLDPAVSEAGDQGRPLLVAHPQSLQAAAFRDAARRLSEKLEPGAAHSEAAPLA